jgi:hypothetical protein
VLQQRPGPAIAQLESDPGHPDPIDVTL